MTVWLNGEFLDADAARIDPADRGFLLGDGAFETMRVETGAIRRWTRHIQRLGDALAIMGIAAPDWDAVHAAAAELAVRNGLDRALARLTVSRGPHGRGFDAPQGEAGTVLLTVSPVPAPEPIDLVTVGWPRRDPFSLSARCKVLGYADALAARRFAKAQGGSMAVMTGAGGRIACADSANLFLIEGGRIYTPALSTGALPGTAREAILTAAETAGLFIEGVAFGPERLAAAQAVVVTNARLGAVGAASLDGRPLRADHPLALKLAAIEADAD